MYIKIKKGTETFKKLSELETKIDLSIKKADEVCKKLGADKWYSSNYGNYLSGRISALEVHVDCNNKISWVICGGESGHGRRNFELDWARSLRDQCASANVPFFFKQIDKVRDKSEGIPEDLQIRQFPKF